MMIGLVSTFVISYQYYYEVLFLFTKPLLEIINKPHMSFIFTDLTEAFLIRIESAFILALISTLCPLFFFNLWAYLKPGLFQYEAKIFTWIISLFILSVSLGFLFGYSKIIPLAWQFFVDFELNADSIPYSILLEARIKDYIDLIFKFTCLIVLAFQIPCLVGIALLTSIVKIDTLIKRRRYIFFFVWVIAALVTPPDIISQVLIAIPLYIAIELGFLLFFILKDTSQSGGIGRRARFRFLSFQRWGFKSPLWYLVNKFINIDNILLEFRVT